MFVQKEGTEKCYGVAKGGQTQGLAATGSFVGSVDLVTGDLEFGATGTVTFEDGQTTLGTGTLNGAWLGAAEAPTKLVNIGISPMVISLIMVIGVFLARWSVPALILGTSSVRADVRRAFRRGRGPRELECQQQERDEGNDDREEERTSRWPAHRCSPLSLSRGNPVPGLTPATTAVNNPGRMAAQ